ncbi:hypothetical protein [Glycomyces xiaoerkulensis]|uniref:hypothetical protein n=1 Tax=Glycomyces xiaoerkulensis TaxID=2038139 RepID=UPI000C2654CF|nr:hypothetical protein [Glycomyces xiaoerkulensis]
MRERALPPDPATSAEDRGDRHRVAPGRHRAGPGRHRRGRGRHRAAPALAHIAAAAVAAIICVGSASAILASGEDLRTGSFVAEQTRIGHERQATERRPSRELRSSPGTASRPELAEDDPAAAAEEADDEAEETPDQTESAEDEEPDPEPDGPPEPVGGLDRAQMDNAVTIIEVGVERGLERRAWAVALATAMQEAKLYNAANTGVPESYDHDWQLEGSDHDSVGIFQQRPSTGWGTVAELMDVSTAAHKFYGGLEEVPGWRNMPLTAAAQTVQRSAHPGRYAQWEDLAWEIIEEYERVN